MPCRATQGGTRVSQEVGGGGKSQARAFMVISTRRKGLGRVNRFGIDQCESFSGLQGMGAVPGHPSWGDRWAVSGLQCESLIEEVGGVWAPD